MRKDSISDCASAIEGEAVKQMALREGRSQFRCFDSPCPLRVERAPTGDRQRKSLSPFCAAKRPNSNDEFKVAVVAQRRLLA